MIIGHASEVCSGNYQAVRNAFARTNLVAILGQRSSFGYRFNYVVCINIRESFGSEVLVLLACPGVILARTRMFTYLTITNYN
jgi:hypothetical protein